MKPGICTGLLSFDPDTGFRQWLPCIWNRVIEANHLQGFDALLREYRFLPGFQFLEF
jgi:hypothetical protein